MVAAYLSVRGRRSRTLHTAFGNSAVTGMCRIRRKQLAKPKVNANLYLFPLERWRVPISTTFIIQSILPASIQRAGKTVVYAALISNDAPHKAPAQKSSQRVGGARSGSLRSAASCQRLSPMFNLSTRAVKVTSSVKVGSTALTRL